MGRITGFKILIISFILLNFTLYPQETSDTFKSELKTYNGEKLSSINEFRENSIKGPQQVNIDEYRLRIKGLVKEPKEYTYSYLIDSLPSKKRVETLHCVEGWSVRILWEGIPLIGLLAKSQPAKEATTVIFYCYDGYTTSLKYDYIKENDLLLAYKMNGLTIPVERGFPFQLMAAGKWGYKWAKWVKEIEFTSNNDYRGFWEQKGYSNEADFDKSFFQR